MMDQDEEIAKWTVGQIHPTPSQIPDGWDLVNLTEVARLETGHTPDKDKEEYWKGDIPWVSLHDTKNLDGLRISETEQTISPLGLSNSSARLLPEGTVVFSRTATVGKATILEREMATSQDFANYICGEDLNNKYLAHLFRFMKPEWERLMAGSTHSTIYMDVFRNLQILLPPLEEQERIAEVLTEVDEQISSLNALIEKKRGVRSATMHRLLRIEERLPGFEGDWETKSYDQVLRRVSPGVTQVKESNVSDHGKYPVVDQGKKKISGYHNDEDKVFSCPDGGIIVFGDHTRIVKFINFDFIVGADGTQLIRGGNGVNTEFLCYMLETKEIPETGYNRHFKFLKLMSFQIPDLREQKAIVSVISDMEDEIAVLEKRRDKMEVIKKGMMQEIFTGKTRLR